MRKILCLFLVSFFFPMAVNAQTPSPKEKPAKEAPKTESERKGQERNDLDGFFKKGEENAKTSSCDKPAKPTYPVA